MISTMIATRGYAAPSPHAPLAPFQFGRRAPREFDVLVEILYCGVCHSDIHTARGEWGGTTYRVVPGHEIVGKVSRSGAKVTPFKPGDIAGVGCFVDPCRECDECRRGEEQ